ncbi:putative cysteine desulfurase [Candidatus Terasakiella magnetica]|nr:putative cysteine desulfurase [Candidatus Terasakiella magnetica]
MITALRSLFPSLQPPGRHYLDSAAMAQSPALVMEAVARHERDARANVHRGMHEMAQRADAAYDGARDSVAAFLSAPAEEVIFTGGCTAALNLAARALAEALGPGDVVVTTEAEHHSSLLPWIMLAQAKGFALRRLPVGGDGRLDLGDLSLIDARCRVVAATHASNVTGAVSDIPLLAEAAHRVGAVVVVDGAQMAPHGPLDPRALGADLYAVSGHKVFGPTGIGVLWGRRELLARLPPVVWGGGMVGEVDDGEIGFLDPPQRFEAGTPPVAPAVGLGAALDWLRGLDWSAIREHEAMLTGRLLDGLAVLPGVRVIGPTYLADRLPVVSFTVAGCHPHDLSHLLAERGVAVRGGAHCARPLMRAMGVEEGTLRASLALYSNAADVEALLSALAEAIKVLR